MALSERALYVGAVSGTVPEVPVINSRSGQLFEKGLVEKYIQEHGKDPVTGETTSVEDLIAVKTNKAVKPRPSPATSIPGLLNLFHNEWDAVMLETHQLRTSLNTVRQEMAHALYQHDAACRAIARLTRERDEARQALVTAESAPPPRAEDLANGKRAATDDAHEVPTKRAKAGITPDVVEAMTAASQVLSKGRKKRVIPASVAPPEAIEALQLATAQPLHKTSKPGILAIECAPDSAGVVASAGADGGVVVFDTAAQRIISTLHGHTKRATALAWLGRDELLASASADKTVCLWRRGDEGAFDTQPAALFKDHADEVTAVTLHATKDYFATASLDKTWCFYDLQTALCLTQVADPGVEAGFSCAAFHPDGLILGTGTADSLVRIWEVRAQKNVAKIEGHRGPVTGLSFSENGYYLATAAADGAKLWDLRKLRNFRSVELEGGAAAVRFDVSGLYLGVAASGDARVLGSKQDWAALRTLADLPKKGASAVAWGVDARTLFVGAADHNLRIFKAPAEDDE